MNLQFLSAEVENMLLSVFMNPFQAAYSSFPQREEMAWVSVCKYRHTYKNMYEGYVYVSMNVDNI